MRNIWLLLLMMPLLVLADARVYVDSDSCHVPYVGEDTDNEAKLARCGTGIHQDGAVQYYFATAKRRWLSAAQVPLAYAEYVDGYYMAHTNNLAAGGEVCELRDDDGNAYVGRTWSTTILVRRVDGPGGFEAEYHIRCTDVEER